MQCRNASESSIQQALQLLVKVPELGADRVEKKSCSTGRGAQDSIDIKLSIRDTRRVGANVPHAPDTVRRLDRTPDLRRARVRTFCDYASRPTLRGSLSAVPRHLPTPRLHRTRRTLNPPSLEGWKLAHSLTVTISLVALLRPSARRGAGTRSVGPDR